MSDADTIVLFAGIITCGLMAGLFFGWMLSVMPGLRKVSDSEYVATMQAINRSIQNPVFLLLFIGTLGALVAGAIMHIGADDGEGRWLAAAAVTYGIGVFGLTVGGNVPLNERLDRFTLAGASAADISAARKAYEGPWNRRHVVRSLLNVVAFALAVAAALASAGAI